MATLKPKRKIPLKLIIGAIALALVLIGAAVGLYLAKQNADTRQQASGGGSCVGGPAPASQCGIKGGGVINCGSRGDANSCGQLKCAGCTWVAAGGGAPAPTSAPGTGGFNAAACTNACKAGKGSVNGGVVGGRQLAGKNDGNVANCECYCQVGNWIDGFSKCDGGQAGTECTTGQTGNRGGVAYVCVNGNWLPAGSGGTTPGTGTGGPIITPGSAGATCTSDSDCSSTFATMRCLLCSGGFVKDGQKVCIGVNQGKSVNYSISCGGFASATNKVCVPGDRKACGDCSGARCGCDANGNGCRPCTEADYGGNAPTRQAYCNAFGQWDCVRTDRCGEIGNREVGAACIYDSSCLSGNCVNGACAAGGAVDTKCSYGSNCVSGKCTNGVCTTGSDDLDNICRNEPDRPACTTRPGGTCRIPDGRIVNSGGFAGCGNLYGKPSDYDCFCQSGNVSCAFDADRQSCAAPAGSTPIAQAPASTPPATQTPVPSPTPTPTPSPSPTYTCNSQCTTTPQCQTANSNYICYNGNCRLSDAQESPTCTYTTPSPSPSSSYTCNSPCTSTPQCQTANSNYTCYNGTCRLNDALESTTCTYPTPTPSPVVGCNYVCVNNSDCAATNQICVDTTQGKRCRLETNISSETCQPPVVVQPTPSPQPTLPPQLPVAGPTDGWMFVLGGAAAVILGAVALILL